MPGKSVMSEIDIAEDDIKSCLYRLEQLERNLKFKPMTNEEREASEKDFEELKKILKKQESDLKELRSQNRNSTYYSFLLIFAGIIIFAIFYMITTDSNNQKPAAASLPK